MRADQGTLFPGLSLTPPAGELVAFRYSTYDVPFWVRPNTEPQRWNRAGEAPTQYWSLSPEGAWAELIRSQHITDEQTLDLVRVTIWACRVPSLGLLDLNRAEGRARYELSEADLTADDWSACQRAAGQMRADGVRGIVTPSAALAGAQSVTLFGPRRPIAFDRAPRLASAVPTAVVAIGRPPRGLVDRVTRRFPSGRLFN